VYRLLRFIIAGCAVIGGVQSASADTVAVEIMRCGMNRLYFSAGTESHIFPNCRFEVKCGDLDAINGCIEYSLPGVSVSTELDIDCTVIDPAICRATIDGFTVDSISSIRIGQAVGPWIELLFGGGATPSDSVGRVDLEAYGYGERASERMRFDFGRGNIDGHISYRSSGVRDGAVERVDAAWIVVLVPNLERSVNDQGVLTTALYYAYNASKLPLMFDGDHANEITSLVPALDRRTRLFAYDESRGRALLQSALGERREVVIGITDPSLRRTAAYFADVLAREQIVTRIVTDRTAADCYFSFAPVDVYNDGYTMRYLLSRLSEVDASTPAIRESIAVAKNHLDRAGRSNGTDRLADLRLAEHRVIEGIGVFPLFLPSLHMQLSPSIIGLVPDEHGRLDLDGCYRLKPPASLDEGQR
jgi:hypothetical protein